MNNNPNLVYLSNSKMIYPILTLKNVANKTHV